MADEEGPVNFIDKYSPKSMSEFIGNEKAIQLIINWLKTRPTKGLAILGESGTGKTTLVGLLAKEFAQTANFVWLAPEELNTSGSTCLAKYKSNDLLRFLGMNQQKFLIVDDSYALKASKQVKDLIKATTDEIPIIFITDNPKVIKRVRNVTCISLKMLPMKSILPHFTKVLAAEKIKGITQKDLAGIIKGNQFDFRSVFQYLDLYYRGKLASKAKATPLQHSFKDNKTNDQDLVDALLTRKFEAREENMYHIYHEGITNLMHKTYVDVGFGSKNHGNDMGILDVLSNCADVFSNGDAYLHENTFSTICNHYYHHVIHLTVPFILNRVPGRVGQTVHVT